MARVSARCALSTGTRTGCFAVAAAVVIAVTIAVVLRLVVARCSWCRAHMRARPMTGRRTVQKLEKPSEHALACTTLRNPANPVVPLHRGLSVCSWPSEHTATGPGPDDAIALRERRSHLRRFKNVATFPSPEARPDMAEARHRINYTAWTTSSNSDTQCVHHIRKSMRYVNPRSKTLRASRCTDLGH